MSTFFVEPMGFPVDSAHVHTLQDALNAAVAKDTIQIEPGATIASLGNTSGAATPASTLAAPSLTGASSITVNNYIGAGEVIQVGTGGALVESDLVLSSALASSGQFTLTLKQPLANAHVAGDRVDTLGQLGIGKAIAVQGDTVGGQVTLNTPLVIWGGTSGVLLRTLTFNSTLTLMAGSNATTILNSVLGAVTEAASPASNGGHNLFREVTFTGPVTLNGNPSGTNTGDQILNSQFQGALLTLTGNDGTLLQNNVFNDAGNVSAITVTSSQNVQLTGNKITVVNGGGLLNGPADITIGSATTGTLSVTLINNTFSTAGTGVGVFVLTPTNTGGNIRVFLQGNDFHYNFIGLADQGDGSNGSNSAGIIDAGVGVLGSLGGNNFRQFLKSDATAGNRFAIYIFGTQGAAGNINAEDNLFSTSTPVDVIKDFADNTAAGAPLLPGSGTITVGTKTQQLSAEQQFVQSLFNDFLGRSGTQDELNGWVALLPTVGHAGVGNSIIHSPEALTRLVDSFYEKFLGRPADSAGEAGWVSFMQKGGTLEQLTANFVASPEYYDRQNSLNNSPDAAFVQSLYNVLLGRVGTNSEVGGWVAKLATGTSRTAVALAITQSAEFRTLAVTQSYFNLLHRQNFPGTAQINGWVNSGFDVLSIEVDFTGTAEFFLNG
ncbi:MAG TPA: DUF4214 domain-containing protein [Gemmataceae bacterium]|nr:DUF4214 domain-containing protein [Gemmataceae bacterium]